MLMSNRYVVLGTFIDLDDDVVLGYFDRLEYARQFRDNLLNKKCVNTDYEALEYVHIYKLKGVE